LIKQLPVFFIKHKLNINRWSASAPLY